MEEDFLRKRNAREHLRVVNELSLDQHDFLRGLDEQERGQFREYLEKKELPRGTRLCSEGAPADRMWILVRGSVSVRLRVPDSRGSRRMASLPMGTVTGSMALIGQDTLMLADIVCDEPVVCYELERSTFFQHIVSDHPHLASKLLMNVSRELMRRLRTTFDDFREVTS